MNIHIKHNSTQVPKQMSSEETKNTKTPPQIFLVEEGEGARLDRWLKRQIPHLKQSVLERLLRTGKIRLNDKKAKSGDHLQLGDTLSIHGDISKYTTPDTTYPEEKKKPALLYTPEEMDCLESMIVWEDENFLVLNKPSGLAVQGGTKTVRHVDGLLVQYGHMKNCRYRLVHRIDKDTSGILVVAKTAAMATYLTECFRKGELEKTYWAIVVDHPTPGYGTIKAPLIKAGSGDREKVVVDSKLGKKAVTHYRTVKRLIAKKFPSLSWLELTPETGRTHQIRVHCAHMETPIVGDGKYGGFMSTSVNKTLHLHARSLVVRDRDGNRFKFVAPPPEHFVKTLEQYQVQWNQVI